MTIRDLLNEIEPFCVEYKLGKSQFGQLACKNHNLLNDLRAGQAPTLTTINRILNFMKKYKYNKDREMSRFFKPQNRTGFYNGGKGTWA